MVVFEEGLVEQLEKQGKAIYPEECCGVLFGERGADGVRHVRQLYPVQNQEKNHNRRKKGFLISPDKLQNAEIVADILGYEIIGFYHSHPDRDAVASEADSKNAIPGFSYPILSVQEDGQTILRSWELGADFSRWKLKWEGIAINEKTEEVKV